MVLYTFAQIYHIIQLLLKNVRRCTFSGKQNQWLDLVKIINKHILSALLHYNNHLQKIKYLSSQRPCMNQDNLSFCHDTVLMYSSITYAIVNYKFIFQTRQFSHMSYCALGLRTQKETWFRKTEPQNVFKTKCSNEVTK